MKEWLQLALQGAVVRRALACAAVVGAVLIAINHGHAILGGEVTTYRIVQMGLTLLVPYCVSTFSSDAAMRGDRRSREAGADRQP